jgi:hypothetical protein
MRSTPFITNFEGILGNLINPVYAEGEAKGLRPIELGVGGQSLQIGENQECQ